MLLFLLGSETGTVKIFTSVALIDFVLFDRPQIKLFVQGLFDLDNDISAFKEHLRDFLIQIKVIVLLLLVIFAVVSFYW